MLKLYDIVHGHAKESPDQVAICDASSSLSYAELERKACELAGYLYRQNITPQSRVIIALPKSIEFVVCMLAVIKLHATYVPLNIEDPSDRQRYIINDVQGAALITNDEYLHLYADCDIPVLCLSNVVKEGFLEPAPVFDSCSEHACIFYTSGTTGRPKGVLIKTASLINLAYNPSYVSLKQGSRIAQAANIAFDASSFELWAALLNLCTLVVTPNCVLLNQQTFKQYLKRHRIDVLWLTASLFDIFSSYDAQFFSGISTLLIGGEALNTDSVRRVLFSKNSPKEIINGYGPTECTTFAITHSIVKKDFTGEGIPIGRPLRAVECYILDENQKQISDGGVGALYIAGCCVADGYLNNDVLTKKHFIPNPFNKKEGFETLYMTGDLVRRDQVGLLHYCGRTDTQIKIRGYRVELDSIVNTIQNTGLVDRAIALIEGDCDNKEIVVYYVKKAELADNISEQLITLMRDSLPTFAIPSQLISINGFMFTPNGKIDRSKLNKHSQLTQSHLTTQGSEPEIINLLRPMLRDVPLSLSTSIKSLNVNSLKAMRIACVVSEHYKRHINPSVILEAKDFLDLEQRILSEHHLPLLPQMRKNTKQAQVPITYQQEQIYFLHKINRSNKAYNAQLCFNFDGELNISVLKETLLRILQRHEVLRTAFVETGEMVVQKVVDIFDIDIPLVKLVGASQNEKEAAYRKALKRTVSHRFNLASPPLIKWALFQFSPSKFRLLQIEHHFIHDGWSLGIIAKEWLALYETLLDGLTAVLPELKYQYRDYALWQRDWLLTDQYEKQLAYWQETLKDCPSSVSLYSDKPRPARQTFNGKLIRKTLSQNHYEALRQFAHSCEITLFDLLFSAFTLLIHHRTQATDIPIGSAVANRTLPHTNEIIGMFVNTIVLRTTIQEEETIFEFLKRQRQNIQSAFNNQSMPLEHIVKQLKVPRSSAQNPLFQLMFAFHDSPIPEMKTEKLSVDIKVEHNGSAKNDLNVICIPRKEQAEDLLGSNTCEHSLEILFEYNSDLYYKKTIDYLISDYIELLSEMIKGKNRTISSMNVLSKSSLTLIKAGTTGPVVKRENSNFIINRIVLVARENPNAIALVDGSSTITYASLLDKASSLACELKSKKIDARSRVGITCANLIEHTSSVLACLLANIPYVPVAPELPEKMVAHIVSDANIAIVLTDKQTPWPFNYLISTIQMHKRSHFTSMNVPEPLRPFHLDDVTHIIYTSGSTGVPKGVELTRGNLLYQTNSRGSSYPASQSIFVPLSLSFDTANSVLLWGLATGAANFIDKQALNNPPEMRQQLIKHNTDIAIFTPSLYQQILPHLSKIGSLKTIVLGGEACHPTLLKQHQLLMPDASLYFEYGLTETSVYNNSKKLYDAMTRRKSRLINIGKPIANTSIHILNKHGGITPVGAIGELYVAGPALAKGYTNQGLTQKFFKEQIVFKKQIRLYKTGDLGRRTGQGEIQLVGRSDRQVKWRGYRIDLDSIEYLLEKIDKVEGAAVVLKKEEQSFSLFAFVVLKKNKYAARKDEMEAEIAVELPVYMRPSRVFILDDMPLTSHGKTDSALLLSYAKKQNTTSLEKNNTSSVTQEKVLAVWRQVLANNILTENDNFFDSGGDSIKVLHCSAKLQDAGVPIQPYDIFEHPFAGELADFVDKNKNELIVMPQPSLSHQSGAEFELTPIQSWFFEQQLQVDNHFNQSLVLRINTLISDEEHRVIITALVKNNAALRLVFKQGADGRWLQRYMDFDKALIKEITETVSISECNGDRAQFHKPLQQVARAYQKQLSINKGPLIKSLLIDGEYLVLIAHHLVVDYVSWGIIQRDLNKLYSLIRNDGSTKLNKQTVRYEQWAAYLHAPQNIKRVQSEKAYWLNTISKYSEPSTDLDEGVCKFGDMSKIEFYLSRDTSARLLSRVKENLNLPIRDVILASFLRALAPLFVNHLVYIGLESHGRESIGGTINMGETVGWFTSYFPAVFDVSSNATAWQYLHDIHIQLNAIPRNGLGYGMLNYISKSLKPHGAPRISFNFLGHQKSNDNSSDQFEPCKYAIAGNNISAENTMPQWLDINCSFRDDKLSCQVLYSNKHYKESTCRELVEKTEDELKEYIMTKKTLRMFNHDVRANHKSDCAIVFIHPINGKLQGYNQVIQALSKEHFVYGFDSINLLDNDEFTTIPDMAEAYIDQLRPHIEGKHTIICGWSFGAFVAHEMTDRLIRDGMSASSFIIDQVIPVKVCKFDLLEVTSLAKVLPNEPSVILATKSLFKAHSFREMIIQVDKVCAKISSGSMRKHFTEVAKLHLAHFAAMQDYVVPASAGRIFLVMSTKTVAKHSTLDQEGFGWGQYSKLNIPIKVFEGDHFSILEDASYKKIVRYIMHALSVVLFDHEGK